MTARTANKRLQKSPPQRAAEAGLKDAARTRARILEAAQDAFSTRGYPHAGLREIAAAAGANVSLVGRYFGSKEGLFAAALDQMLHDDLWDVPRETFGRAIVAKFLDDGKGSRNPLPMLMLAAADPVAQSVALGLIRTKLIAPLGKWIGPPSGEARAGEVMALCAGFFTYRIMLPLKPFAGALDPAVRAWLQTALQDIVDGRAPR